MRPALALLPLTLALAAAPAFAGPIVGIDLGTTYSCVTVVKNGEVEVVANDLGRRTVPSWVAFAGDRRLIGQAAKTQASQNPRNTIYDSKRLIGQPFKAVKRDLSFYSFDVKKSAWVRICIYMYICLHIHRHLLYSIPRRCRNIGIRTHVHTFVISFA